MLNFTKKSEVKKAIGSERELVNSYKKYELEMKGSLESYLNEFKNVSFDNEALKTMLLNNFDNAIMQLDNNLLDIDSVNNVIDILDSQGNISASDVETYNKLSEKTRKDLELTQNFIQKTMNCFENVSITGKKKSIAVLEDCKKTILSDFPFTNVVVAPKEEKVTKKPELKTKSIQKNFDYSSSDLLCFFPKSPNDNLVLSTIQNNYKISFKNTTATIYIEDEDFHISLNTPGVQISNTNTNNILFVSHSGMKYTIITNNQIEIPSFIQVSKISKNEDFLEVEISRNYLTLNVKDNVLNFDGEDSESDETIISNNVKNENEECIKTHPNIYEIIPENSEVNDNNDITNINNIAVAANPVSTQVAPQEQINIQEPVLTQVSTPVSAQQQAATIAQVSTPVSTQPQTSTIAQMTAPVSAQSQTSIDAQVSTPVASQLQAAIVAPTPAPASITTEPTPVSIPVSEQVNEIVNAPVQQINTATNENAPNGKHSASESNDEIADNDTLIISDSNKTVILPYKISDLQQKMQKNKNYKSLRDVVDKEYTIPIDTFKNPVKSRFREAFQLIKKKEHGSLKEAVGLGFELMFQSNLNPAVIAACKDLDELDIYLDCLDDNELDKFSCFKILYTVPPSKH